MWPRDDRGGERVYPEMERVYPDVERVYPDVVLARPGEVREPARPADRVFALALYLVGATVMVAVGWTLIEIARGDWSHAHPHGKGIVWASVVVDGLIAAAFLRGGARAWKRRPRLLTKLIFLVVAVGLFVLVASRPTIVGLAWSSALLAPIVVSIALDLRTKHKTAKPAPALPTGTDSN